MKFFIPVLIGAVIGYITNWLAIRMLFRPYREVRIFGLKVPFTPGLIPKERDRIAKSIGETVGTHLLTPEIVVKALCSERIDSQIDVMIKEKIGELRESRLSINELGAKISGLSENEISLKAGKFVSGFILSKLGNERIRHVIKDILRKEILEGSKGMKESELFGNLREYILKKVAAALISEDSSQLIKSYIIRGIDGLRQDTRRLEDIVPKSLHQQLRIYIYNNREKTIGIIKDGLGDEAVRGKLKVTISDMVEESLGRLVTMFISMDTIGNKVLESIDKYMDKPENQENVINLIINSLDRFMSVRVSEVTDSLSPEIASNLAAELSNLVLSHMSEEKLASTLRGFADRSFENSNEELVEIVFSTSDAYIENLLKSEKLEGFVSFLVHEYLANGLFNQPVSKYINKLSETYLEKVSMIVRSYYDEFVKNKASQMIELIDIAGIVEERINSFDVAFAESIILEVASRELRAITWLGALLGAVMGILSPVIQILTE